MRLLILSSLLLCAGPLACDPAPDIIFQSVESSEVADLKKLFEEAHPFKYDLNPTVIPGDSSKVLLCLHGFGLSSSYAEQIKPHLNHTVVTFNFPDYGTSDKKYQLNSTFGTIQELLPVFYMLKKCVIDGGIEKIDLYGYSAGGGAAINTIAILKTSRYDFYLKNLGIDAAEKEKILKALQRGTIILDTPLKSIEEIIALRGSSIALQFIKLRHKSNNFRPIDALCHLDGFKVIVHFQVPDKVISNRDDDLFIEKLKQYNKSGTVHVVKGSDGGHTPPHTSLWKFHQSLSDSP